MSKRVYLWAGAALLAAMGTSSASFAGTVSVRVIVQIGSQVQPTAIVQNSSANTARLVQFGGTQQPANGLVVQAGSTNDALVVQQGPTTNAVIGQFGTNNTAGVAQAGGLNNAVVIQGP
jgi:hypothetical protein